MQINLKFPIERVEKALQTVCTLFDDERMNDNLVAISLKEGENSKQNPTCVFTKDKVISAYQDALEKDENTVEILYEAPSEKMFREAGFIRQGDYMIHKEEAIRATKL